MIGKLIRQMTFVAMAALWTPCLFAVNAVLRDGRTDWLEPSNWSDATTGDTLAAAPAMK